VRTPYVASGVSRSNSPCAAATPCGISDAIGFGDLGCKVKGSGFGDWGLGIKVRGLEDLRCKV